MPPRFIVCFSLIRIVLPVCLAASFLFRQNVLSLIYLLLLLYIPMVQVPTEKTMAGGTRIYLRVVMIISILISIAQLSFHIVLLSMPPYGGFLPHCDFLEKLLRHIGFIRFDQISILNCVISICPEVIMLVASIVVYVICVKLTRKTRKRSSTSETLQLESGIKRSRRRSYRFLMAIGKYLCLALLCLAGVMRPSLLSAVYFLTFLGSMTWWSSYRSLGKPFAIVLRCVCVVAVVHILALFLIQTQWVQQLIGEDCNYCRYLGLTPLRVTSCIDPRGFSFRDTEWASYLNPVVLIVMYYILMLESRLLMNPRLMRSISPSGKYHRSNSANSAGMSSGVGVLYQDPLGSVIITDHHDDLIQLNSFGDTEPPAENHKENAPTTTILDHLLSAAISVIQLINKSSYIATNIIMMAWSITYHSWITFVLLLWASLLWMMPNQRRAMLRCSPFLVCYATLLLIAQYIYSMDLTEDELPQEVQGFNLRQIGFQKPTSLPVKPLLAKCMYTVMFWLTLRQYMQEKVEDRRSSALEDMVAPLAITVGTATRGFSEQMETIPSPFMSRVGTFMKQLLTKFCIWVVAIMLFVIGISGDRMTVIRVIYMALFLVFILTFQLSYQAWRRMLFGFWITVIIYSMTVLVAVYTYQFDNFEDYWAVLCIDEELQLDIGLEKFETADLFFRLLVPTFFLIVTVIQLHYFHKDFLALSDISYKRHSVRTRESSVMRSEGSSAAATREMEEMEREVEITVIEPQEIPSLPSFRQLKNVTITEVKLLLHHLYRRIMEVIDFLWLFLELHILKIMLLSIMLMCIYDVCGLHFIFLLLAVVALLFNSRVHLIICHICSVLIGVILLAKMVYQIDYISHEKYAANCKNMMYQPNTSSIVQQRTFYTPQLFDTTSRPNLTMNNADWFGFHKTSDSKSLPGLLKGHIGIILVGTVMALVNVRQRYARHLMGRYIGRPHSMFPHVKREDADKDLATCIKYLFNYGFYKFGVEICLMTCVALIGTRMDVYSVFYAIWLCYLYKQPREKLAKVWIFFQTFIVVTTPLQYAMAIGVPPGLCVVYPWSRSEILRRVQDWMYLPDSTHLPDAYKLLCDFILLLFTCRQSLVFRIERRHEDLEYPGGTNKDVTAEAETPGFQNPVPDHISYIRSWLDIFKRIALSAFMWITLATVFLAGTLRTNVFSIGYLVGAFILLWQGEDLYLRPIKVILRWWNALLGFNVLVICAKTLLQIPGCIFAEVMQVEACWVMQLFGIACIQRFHTTTASAGIADPAEKCSVNRDDVGLVWDGVCFGFLLMMRRLFNSYYFMHQVDETKAMTILASRGAELIDELREKQIVEQQDEEHTILEKIKLKMERIKATQQKIQGPMFKEPGSHYVAIRSGDYYMFDEFDDEDLEEERAELLRADDDEDEPEMGRRVTLGKLFETAMKTDFENAADVALRSEQRSDGEELKNESASHMATRPSFHSALSDDLNTPLASPGAMSAGSHQLMSGDEDDRTAPPSMGSRRPSMGSRRPSMGSRRPSKGGSDYSGSEVELESISKEDEVKSTTFWQRIWSYIKFAWAFVESAMVSVTRYLNHFSRDYRYVVKVLAMEKKMLKEKSGFGAGTRSGSSMVWQPCPDTLLDRSRTSLYNPSLDELEEIHELSAQDQIPIIRLMLALWFAIISHSDIACYFVIFLNQINSATILSIPLPLMVFLWGTLTVPRPTKTFWVTIIAYTEVIVIIKCMFQFELLPWNEQEVPDNMPFYPPRIIGIERPRNGASNYAMYDLVLLLFVFFHRFMLKSLGLWKTLDEPTSIQPNTDELYELEMENGEKPVKDLKESPKPTLPDARKPQDSLVVANEPSIVIVPEQPDSVLGGVGRRRSSEIRHLETHLRHHLPDSRLTLHRAGSCASTHSRNANRGARRLKFNEEENREQLYQVGSRTSSISKTTTRNTVAVHTEEEEVADHLPGAMKMVVVRYFESLRNFFSDLLSPFARITVDVYAYMFICDFINFMVVIFGFADFGTQQGDGGVSAYLEENKVPIAFLVMLILQFLLIIIDRALFLRKFILGKIVFQFILIIGVHIWMFFILPLVTERQFNKSQSPQMWYMVKCFYLLLSAYQIRCGYPTRILGNFLCKRYNIINMVLFKCFMAVPFLFELRALMDWIWTDTSMTLMDWLKMEDIFAHIFQLKCARRMEAKYPAPRGEKKAPYLKYLVGGGALFIIIAIIWFPLVLFALGNTVGEPNLPYDVSVTLRIGPYEPIYKMSAQSTNIKKFTEQQWSQMSNNYLRDQVAQSFLSNYDYRDAAVVTLSHSSTNTWGISPPDKARLIKEVENNAPLTLKFTWIVSRISNNPSIAGISTESQDHDLEIKTGGGLHENRILLLKMLKGEYGTEPIIIADIFPKFIKITNRAKAPVVTQLMKGPRGLIDASYRSLKLKVGAEGVCHKPGPETGDANNAGPMKCPVEWWELTESCTTKDEPYEKYLSKLPFVDCSNLNIYTFSDKKFPETLNLFSGGGQFSSIIGLYVGIVLVAFRFFRGIFGGMSMRIMFDEMPNVDRMLQLCLDIYLVRESGELDLEEDLFAKLVFLYRSPETLIKWTRPREENEADGDDEQPAGGNN